MFWNSLSGSWTRGFSDLLRMERDPPEEGTIFAVADEIALVMLSWSHLPAWETVEEEMAVELRKLRMILMMRRQGTRNHMAGASYPSPPGLHELDTLLWTCRMVSRLLTGGLPVEIPDGMEDGRRVWIVMRMIIRSTANNMSSVQAPWSDDERIVFLIPK